MSSTNLPARTWFLVGVAMLCSLKIGAMAFRSLGPRAGRKRGNILSSTAGASGSAKSSPTAGPPDLANLRENYESSGIDETTLPTQPHVLMQKWVEEACNCQEVIEPNAMCLATVGEAGKPSARFVLMKGFDERGVTWYTNYNSRKSQELKAFPHAAITFWWGALHRSVRFEGEVAMISEEESDEYFSCRPTGSKIGAWVSDQSEPILSRDEMERKAEEITPAKLEICPSVTDFLSRKPLPRRETTYLAPRIGAASGSGPRAWSSGRDSPPACTTDSSTPLRRKREERRARRGRSHGCSHKIVCPPACLLCLKLVVDNGSVGQPPMTSLALSSATFTQEACFRAVEIRNRKKHALFAGNRKLDVSANCTPTLTFSCLWLYANKLMDLWYRQWVPSNPSKDGQTGLAAHHREIMRGVEARFCLPSQHVGLHTINFGVGGAERRDTKPVSARQTDVVFSEKKRLLKRSAAAEIKTARTL